MKLLVMNGDTVANVIEVDPDNIPPAFADCPEAPDGVGVGMVWDGQGYAAPNRPIEELRANATIPKDDFILAALDAGVLSETDAEEAIRGWPTGWEAFFEGRPARSRVKAKARWEVATYVARNAPLIEALAHFKKLSPEQVDALFGIA